MICEVPRGEEARAAAIVCALRLPLIAADVPVVVVVLFVVVAVAAAVDPPSLPYSPSSRALTTPPAEAVARRHHAAQSRKPPAAPHRTRHLRSPEPDRPDYPQCPPAPVLLLSLHRLWQLSWLERRLILPLQLERSRHRLWRCQIPPWRSSVFWLHRAFFLPPPLSSPLTISSRARAGP